VSALDFIDCSALGALLRVRGLARRRGGDVVLAAPQPYVLRLLVLTGNDEVFRVQADVEAAVASVARRRRRYRWRRLAVRAAAGALNWPVKLPADGAGSGDDQGDVIGDGGTGSAVLLSGYLARIRAISPVGGGEACITSVRSGRVPLT